MPITTIGSYISTAQNVVAHWTDVNEDRVANMLAELALLGGYSLTNFTNNLSLVQTGIDAVVGLENANLLAAGDRDAQKENILERLRQFRAALRLHLKGTSYAHAAPKMPALTSSQSKFTRPLADMADLWQRLDASGGVGEFTSPLLLRGGYTQAGFVADLSGLRAAYQAVDHTENDLNLSRRERDQLLDAFRERMLQYRAAIALEYGEGHPFYLSLPDIYPTSGGGTALDTVRYHFVETGASVYDVWVEMIGGLVDVQTLYLRVGTIDFFTAFSPQPGEVFKTQWSGVVISGEIDEVKVRNSQNEDIAVGVNDPTLPNPGP